ncbi:MAG: hypothetical protein KTR28_05920 [Micavibrio sp.]|nr:hypothetical protein [Micavibrio sp.]
MAEKNLPLNEHFKERTSGFVEPVIYKGHTNLVELSINIFQRENLFYTYNTEKNRANRKAHVQRHFNSLKNKAKELDSAYLDYKQNHETFDHYKSFIDYMAENNKAGLFHLRSIFITETNGGIEIIPANYGASTIDELDLLYELNDLYLLNKQFKTDLPIQAEKIKKRHQSSISNMPHPK